jgi:8-oxo-dGTP diphosphatase
MNAVKPSTKKPKRPQWLPVVAGILIRDNQVLLGQRPEHKSLPGLWEFPGGKIELGESPEVALRRELKEELGIDATIGPLRLATTHSYDESGVVLLFFEVRYWTGQPRPVHHLDLKWVNAKDLKTEKLPEANRVILTQILEILE